MPTKSELKELYFSFTHAQKRRFEAEAALRGGPHYLDEVLVEAFEMGREVLASLRLSANQEGDSQRVSEDAPVVQLMSVSGGLL